MMNSTDRRVPLTTGFPTRTLGSIVMRSCQSMKDPLPLLAKVNLSGGVCQHLNGERSHEVFSRGTQVDEVANAAMRRWLWRKLIRIKRAVKNRNLLHRIINRLGTNRRFQQRSVQTDFQIRIEEVQRGAQRVDFDGI